MKRPSLTSLLVLVILIFGCAASSIAAVLCLLYSLVMGTFTQLIGYLVVFGVSYYLTRLFVDLYWSSAYNYALSELDYNLSKGKAVSKFSAMILDTYKDRTPNRVYEA